MQRTTLVFLLKDDQILLAMKKRGTGEGKWNGVGGKVDTDEGIQAAAIRECREEIGLILRFLELRAIINFRIPDWNFHNVSYVYTTKRWEGEPVETEEMAPRWFSIDQIPFNQMWDADRFWLPEMLAGKVFRADLTFDNAGKVIKQSFEPCENLTEE